MPTIFDIISSIKISLHKAFLANAKKWRIQNFAIKRKEITKTSQKRPDILLGLYAIAVNIPNNRFTITAYRGHTLDL